MKNREKEEKGKPEGRAHTDLTGGVQRSLTSGNCKNVFYRT